jgi:hypothetical protein
MPRQTRAKSAGAFSLQAPHRSFTKVAQRLAYPRSEPRRNCPSAARSSSRRRTRRTSRRSPSAADAENDALAQKCQYPANIQDVAATPSIKGEQLEVSVHRPEPVPHTLRAASAAGCRGVHALPRHRRGDRYLNAFEAAPSSVLGLFWAPLTKHGSLRRPLVSGPSFDGPYASPGAIFLRREPPGHFFRDGAPVH